LLVKPTPRNVNLGSGRFAMLNKERDISFGKSDLIYLRFVMFWWPRSRASL
jgi:hypothetical protein